MNGTLTNIRTDLDSLSIFPKFQPIDLNLKGIIDRSIGPLIPSTSELTFANLYAWRAAYHFAVSRHGDHILVRTEEKPPFKFLPPLGPGKMQAEMLSLLLDTGATFIRIPETMKSLLESDSRFRIELDLPNSDYLFLIKDLAALSGQKYDGKRNQIKKFKKNYSFDYILFNTENIQECLSFEKNWCEIKGCDLVEGLREERQAIHEMIDHFEYLELFGGGIKVNDRLCAMAIADKLSEDTLVLRVLKADPNYPGLYQTMCNEFFIRQARGFTYANFEQDLGIAGLRKAKLSYQPIQMINKYTVSLST